jgi:hypothetical protein
MLSADEFETTILSLPKLEGFFLAHILNEGIK